MKVLVVVDDLYINISLQPEPVVNRFLPWEFKPERFLDADGQ